MDQSPPKHQAMIGGKDRISELPDSIICKILSNFPTKEAVATTILSKRWNGQWTYCFNLDFNDDEFLINGEEDEKTCPVKDVIALNKSPYIKKFRLQTDMMYEYDVTGCLDSMLRRNVEAIELFDGHNFYNYFPSSLPQSLFTCQTLVFLEILSNARFDIPASVHLPSLKVLRVNLYEPTNAVTTTMFCGLPVLEDLLVSIWSFGDEEVTLNICTPSLKKLKLSVSFGSVTPIVVIRAPSLEEIDIDNDVMAKYVFEELPMDVKSRVKGVGMCTLEHENETLATHAIQFMNGISRFKSLALSSCNLGTYFRNAPPLVALFPNVTCLEVDVTSCCGFTYLPYLFDRLPNLVSLVLDMVPSYIKHLKFAEPLEHVPQCLLLHLKRIEVKGFDWQENELDFIEYLLKFAQVLDEVVICTHNIALEERIRQKLSSFPWGSKNCRLKIL